MNDLADNQARFVAVLQQGPIAFPDGLFAGDTEWALLGLKAHANTISHARLIALEQTFPRTLQHLGAEHFNAFSRAFVERPEPRACRLMAIGEGFASFLAACGQDQATIDLARIEWAWLQSYNAAEAAALRLADLACYDEPGLLELTVTVHPAAQLIDISTNVTALLPELADAAAAPPAAVLLTRPDTEVVLTALDAAKASVAGLAKKSPTMRNLLAAALETAGEAEALPAVFALIEAGMLASPAD